MSEIRTEAVWNEDDSRTFLDLGRYFVPHRDEQTRIICDLIPPPPPQALFVELCSGAGHLSRALLDRFPTCTLLAFDGSETMRRTTLEACALHAGRVTVRAFDLAAGDWRRLAEPIHAVVSSLAIHHLDGSQKRDLFKDMAAALAPGGVIVIADIVRPTTDAALGVAALQWDEAVRNRAQTLDGHLRAFEQFQALRWNYFRDPDGDSIDKPSSLRDQLEWLVAAGLVDVDVHWLVAGHAIFSGRKPGTVA
jgi:tRNA (cmo5U34)-methyltransferase